MRRNEETHENYWFLMNTETLYRKYPFPDDPSVIPWTLRVFRRLHTGIARRHVLVVGCGTGEDAVAAALLFPHATITGFDMSDPSIMIAKQRFPHLHFTTCTIEQFLPRRKYDLIICSGVLHHTAEPVANLRRMRSWLSPQGEMWLGVYHHARWECGVDPSRNIAQLMDGTMNPLERTYSWEGITKLVSAAGGRMVRTGHRLPVPRRRVAMLVYDLFFLWRRQQIMMVAVQ